MVECSGKTWVGAWFCEMESVPRGRIANLWRRNKRIFSTRAPSSGAITLSALKIFEGFDGPNFNGTAQPGAPGYNQTEQRCKQCFLNPLHQERPS